MVKSQKGSKPRRHPRDTAKPAAAALPRRRAPALISFAIVAAIMAAGAVVWMRWTPGDEPAASAAASGSGRPTSVLLITLDTVRADRLGAYGYAAARTPHLDGLARSGVRFDDATTPAPITGPAHAAILTGMLPARFAIRDNAAALPAEALTLAEVLSQRGFATAGFVGAFILDRPYGFAQGFDTFEGGFTRVDGGQESNVQRQGNAVVDDTLRWLAGVPADRPFFGWVHLYDAHAGYEPPPPFAQSYDGEVEFVDQQVGRLIEAVRARGATANTLIIAAADHGESLGEHGEAEHGVFLYDAVLRIPLIMAGPGTGPGRVVTEQVRAIDIAPTILEALGIPVEGKVDGESLVPLMKGLARAEVPPAYAESYYPKLHYGWSELRAIRADGWKAIDAPTRELYNLREDPGELHNRYPAQQGLADRMIAEAARLERELTGGVAPVAKQPDRETVERLRSLGYVGSSAPLPTGVRGPDPKDRIARQTEYNVLMSRAIDDLRDGQAQAAIPKLKQLVALNGRAYDAHQFLGEAYEKVGQVEAAMGEYAYAALLNPGSVTPLAAAAELHINRGDLASARKRLDEAMKVQPDSHDVHFLRGKLLEREGRLPEAVAAFETAVTINGANPRARVQIAAVASRLGRWQTAEAQLQRLLEMNYQPARTYFALGQMAQRQGRTADAAAKYREALRLEPGLPMALEGLRSLPRK